MKVVINKTDLARIVELAKERYYSNRAAKNSHIQMHTQDAPYYGDVVGLCGEWAALVALGINPHTHTFNYTQSSWNSKKEVVRDAGKYEVRSTTKSHGNLVIKSKDIKNKPSVPYSYVS